MQLCFFGYLSVATHISSLPFVMLLIGLKYFEDNTRLRAVMFVMIVASSGVMSLVYDRLIAFYPLLQFYSNGSSFGLKMFGLATLLFVLSYKSISAKDSNYILLIGLAVYGGTLLIDSSLARLAIPFMIPFLWYKWDVIFNIIHLKNLQVFFAFFVCISLFIVMMNVKSADGNSSLLPYTSFLKLP